MASASANVVMHTYVQIPNAPFAHRGAGLLLYFNITDPRPINDKTMPMLHPVPRMIPNKVFVSSMP